jgi:arylsulfatase A-like enzyme
MGRVLVAVLLATLAACGMPARTGRPNILLVVIDTLRADRLGCYGNARGLTPFLDELAARGHVVRRARAQAPWTNPSVASIFTSRYQSQHRVIDYRSVLPATELTLAEVLKANGYVTGGFSANGLIGESLGFGQGFDQYQAHLLVKGEDPEYMRIPVRADRIAAEALAWLDQLQRDGAAGAPVFLYLQLMEPHAPYAPPAALLDRLRDDRPVDVRRASEHMYLDSLTPVGADELRQIEDVYDASVMAVDLALRDLFAALDAHGFFADAIVVVTADHGEEFQDHGLRGHGKALFDESIHVPLIVLPPGTTVPGDVDRLVSSIDIAPTVLELAGVPIPDRFGGQSFASELEGGWWARSRSALRQLRNAPPAGSSYSENLVPPDVPALPHERALVADDSKIIEWRDGASRFYDLAHDPQEQAPNSVDDAGRARLETSLSQAEARAERDPSLAETKMPDARTREALEALGYIQ